LRPTIADGRCCSGVIEIGDLLANGPADARAAARPVVNARRHVRAVVVECQSERDPPHESREARVVLVGIPVAARSQRVQDADRVALKGRRRRAGGFQEAAVFQRRGEIRGPAPLRDWTCLAELVPRLRRAAHAPAAMSGSRAAATSAGVTTTLMPAERRVHEKEPLVLVGKGDRLDEPLILIQ
jgi:hypothetical protein